MEGLLSESVCKRSVVVRSEPITENYIVEARPFARGKFATVRRCRHRTTGVEYAAKYMRKRRRACDVRHEILHEAHVLELSRMHPHIVRMHEVYETPSEIVLLLELVPGGELQRVLDDEEVVPEAEGKRLLRQILDGVAFLHQHNIAHLDLKPQNLLLTKPFPEGEVKLCDFGISRLITKGIEIREIVGTPDYVAPEVLHYEPISLPTDMWSLGILTYVLLSGHSPFGGDTKQETFCNITRGSLDFPQDLFGGVSDCAVDFVRRLLLRNPKERMTAEESLSHPWLSVSGSPLPGIQLTLSPESALTHNSPQPENISARSPSPLHNGNNPRDSAFHKSPSPMVVRSPANSTLECNGNTQKDDTENSSNAAAVDQINGMACESPSMQHNSFSNSSPTVLRDSSNHDTSVFCKTLPPKVTRSMGINSYLEGSDPVLKSSSQSNGEEHNGDSPCTKLNNALNNNIFCPKPTICTSQSAQVARNALISSSMPCNGNDQKVDSSLDSEKLHRNGHGQSAICHSARTSRSPFNSFSSHCSGNEQERDTRIDSGKQHNGHYQSGFCHSVKVSKSVYNSSSLHYNNIEQESDTSIDCGKQQHNGHEQSALCHSLKVTRSVCKSSTLHCNDQDTYDRDTNKQSNGTSPQRNGSFRQSPSPGRREQKSRNSVDMMVSQFEGISKRIVFSEDICVDERVGMVY